MIKFKEHLRRRLIRLLPGICAGLCVAVGLALALGWVFCTQRIVTVTDTEGLDIVRVTSAHSTQKLLQEAGLSLGKYDSCVLDEELGESEHLHIERGWAVTVRADGEATALRMEGGTVEDALREAGVSLDYDDYTEPELETEVTDEMTVAVHRVEYREYERDETLEPQYVEVPTSLLYRSKDETLIRQEAQPGHALRIRRQRIVDGEVESEEILAEQIFEPVLDEIVAVYGEGVPVSDLEGPELVDGVPENYTQVYTGKATGYSASKTAKGASGMHLTYGTCAVNPALIPYGTKLYITSQDGRFVYGYAIAADTGTAMVSGDVLIDLYYETYIESVENAVIMVNVYVVEE